MNTMTLSEAIIGNLRKRQGFDRAFDLDDDILEEIQQEMAAAIDAHLREREAAKSGVTDQMAVTAFETFISVRNFDMHVAGFGIRAMRAALEAVAPMLASARVPDGWQLVPKKMDANMLREFRRVAGAVIGMHAACMGYIAALAAAPKRGEDV